MLVHQRVIIDDLIHEIDENYNRRHCNMSMS